MNSRGVDPNILEAWLAARSIARGLPVPVSDHGGFRVDTRADSETARWVFPAVSPAIGCLARSISDPLCYLKLCGSGDELRTQLPDGWMLHATSYFMQAISEFPGGCLPEGYSVEVERAGMVSEARIFSEVGTLAASGYAAETGGVFVYDRIVTELGHRRRGLGRALMQTLRDKRKDHDCIELLVATEDGRALYSAIGWKTLSPYSTASIEPAMSGPLDRRSKPRGHRSARN